MIQTPNLTAARSEGQNLSRVSFFGPPPLLPGEDPAAYDVLLARVTGQLKPSDIFEESWTYDIVAVMWEHARWRRYLTDFLVTTLPKVLEETIKPLLEDQDVVPARPRSFVAQIHAAQRRMVGEPDLVRRWAAADAAAIKRVDELLDSIRLTMAHVEAKAAAQALDTIEAFNRLIANTAWQRDAMLRDLQRRRSDFAQRARGQLEQIEDAEFEAVANNTAQKDTTQGNAIQNDRPAAIPAAANTAEVGMIETKPVAKKPVGDQSIQNSSTDVDPVKTVPVPPSAPALRPDLMAALKAMAEGGRLLPSKPTPGHQPHRLRLRQPPPSRCTNGGRS